MKINGSHLYDVIAKLGDIVRPDYSEATVTVGEVDGVVYRIQAISAHKAEDMDVTDIPDWALCVMEDMS